MQQAIEGAFQGTARWVREAFPALLDGHRRTAEKYARGALEYDVVRRAKTFEVQFLAAPDVLAGALVVGDTKQSLYGWRAADVSLLGEIAEENGVDVFSLSVSRRPTRPPLEAQNVLFASAGVRYPDLMSVDEQVR